MYKQNKNEKKLQIHTRLAVFNFLNAQQTTTYFLGYWLVPFYSHTKKSAKENKSDNYQHANQHRQLLLVAIYSHCWGCQILMIPTPL